MNRFHDRKIEIKPDFQCWFASLYPGTDVLLICFRVSDKPGIIHNFQVKHFVFFCQMFTVLRMSYLLLFYAKALLPQIEQHIYIIQGWTQTSLDGFCIPLAHVTNIFCSYASAYYFEKSRKLEILRYFEKQCFWGLGTFRKITRISWCFEDYDYVRKTLWENVVRKTLWERRCESLRDVVRKTLWERRFEKYVVRKTL